MKKPIVATYYQSDKDYMEKYFIKGEKTSELRTHDCNFCLYDFEKDEFVIYELSKATGIKHGISRDIGCDFESSVKWFDLFLKQSGYKNDFSMILNGQFYNKSRYMPFNRYVSGGFMAYNDHLTRYVNSENHYFSASHHICHSYSAYVQSPFSKCAVLSYDANSNEAFYRLSIIDEGRLVKTKNFKNNIYGKSLNRISRRVISTDSISSKTHGLDVVGKMMGLSAYGDYNRQVIQLCKEYITITNLEIENDLNKFETREDLREYHFYLFSLYDDIIGKIMHLKRKHNLTDETMAFCIQFAFEEVVLESLTKHIDFIKEGDNNLVITGGCALNVLTNEKIKRTIGCEVYVPPNPNDSGLTLGAIAEYLFRTDPDWSWKDPKNRKSLRFATVDLIESPRKISSLIKSRGGQEIDLKRLSEILKQGKTVGMLNGKIESGPRALGHRSILCDPSIRNMKDILNSRVKFREWYRPFAPVCREEDINKWFYTPNEKNLNTMGFVVDVRFDSRKLFPAITHVDGTARLQSVSGSDPDDKDLYDLLGYFDGKPLLNTSFNVQGKPIINSLEEALDMLNKTGLDHVCLKHKNKYYLFT